MRALLLVILVIVTAFAGCLEGQDDFEFEPRPSGGGAAGSSDPDDDGRDDPSDDGESEQPENDTDQEDDPPIDEDPDEGPEPEYNPPVAFVEASHEEFFVPFTVSFELDGWDPDGTPIEWSLDFGDGNGTTGDRLPVSLDHTYENPGEFEARLLVSDGTEMRHQTEKLRGSQKPVPAEFEGNVRLPERFDLLGESCISEGVARSLIDAFNTVGENGNEAVDDANDNISETNSNMSSIFNGLLNGINGTVQMLNRTVYDISGGEVWIPYENPNLSAPVLPLLPGIPVSLEYIDGATWNIHYVDSQFWGWNYGFDTQGVMAQFWADNGTSLGQGIAGKIPKGTEFMVVCMTSIPTDEDDLPDWASTVPVDQSYIVTVAPPADLLQKPGPEDIEFPSQSFTGEFSVGICAAPEYISDLEGVYFRELEEIDSTTHGMPYSASFSATGSPLRVVVDFFDSDGFMDQHTGGPMEDEIEGTVPEGATHAFFSACGGTDVTVSYFAGQ